MYQWVCDNLRHFNLPVLYGKPMVGKTLIACAGAWLVGCTENQVASRCTLAFVNSWLTRSSLPFIWDDPTTPEDVCQLAIDVGNGCARGKATADAKRPLTACLVTANFDMQEMMKYFSRLLVVEIKDQLQPQRQGNAKVLDHARRASSALPTILHCLSQLTVDAVHQETTILQTKLPNTPLRILEGMAYPLTVAKMITNLCGRSHLMADVMDYMEDVMFPYYKASLSLAKGPSSTVTPVPHVDYNLEVINNTDATIVKSAEIAMRKSTMKAFINNDNVTEFVKSSGGRVNKTVRLNNLPTKCVTLPRNIFSKELWTALINKIFNIEEEENRTEEDTVNDMAEVPTSPARETNVGQSPPESPTLHNARFDLPPPPPPPTPPPPPMTTSVGDDSFELPPPPSPCDISFDPDETLPMPPVDLLHTMCSKTPVIQRRPQRDISSLVNLMSPKPASLADRCSQCKKVGRTGALWVRCCSCNDWLHRSCSGLSYKDFKKLTEETPWVCSKCS